MSMNFWESLMLSPEWPLWQFIIGTLIAIFAILVIMLVWKIIEKLQEKKIMSSLLKGADKGLWKTANVSESDNIMGQVGEAIGAQANQMISTVQQYSVVNAARAQASENQQNIKDIKAATAQAINGFNIQSNYIDKLGRGKDYSENDVATISYNYTVSSSDISQSINESEASQQNVETPVSESVDEPLMQQPEVDLANASSQVDEAWVKEKVLDFQCVKKSVINYCNLRDDWTFSDLPQRAFMEIYKIFNGKRAEQSLNAEGVKIYNYLCKVKKDRGF